MDWQTVLRGLLATHAALLMGGLIMLLLVAGMLRQQRNPAASAAWLVFMVAVPYAGVPLYLFFGSRKLKAITGGEQRSFSDPNQMDVLRTTGLHRLLAEMRAPAPSITGPVRFHHDADEARTVLLGMLESAQTSIDISMFILSDDRTGREVLQCLARRAENGIAVRLLLDSVGSFNLFKSHLHRLKRAGGQIAWFMPVMHVPMRGRTNFRNHRKMVIVDHEHVWTGGRNLADEYLQPVAQSRWIDLSFDLQGPAVVDYVALFKADWAFATRQARPTPTDEYRVSEHDANLSQLLPSGPDLQDDSLHDTLVRIFMEARERIVIVTPYFVPSEILQSMLCVAVRSGITVEILLPKKSNHRLADFARQRFLRQLDKAGATIRCLPDCMLHAKAVVVDDRYAMVGSANFDLRSLYLNFEMMTLFYARKDIEKLVTWIEAVQRQSIPWIPSSPGLVRETMEGLVLLAAFQL